MLPAPVEAMTRSCPLSISEPPLNVVVMFAPVEESDSSAGPKLRAIVQFCTEMVIFALLPPLNMMPCALVFDPGHDVLLNVLLLMVRLTAAKVVFWMLS